ncbi:hypothetical protein, partial [Mesorhizobium sp. M1A.F.Ca.IN.020.04.1.1]
IDIASLAAEAAKSALGVLSYRRCTVSSPPVPRRPLADFIAVLVVNVHKRPMCMSVAPQSSKARAFDHLKLPPAATTIATT